ncbi:MAG: hypothetical protein ACJ77B_04220 [Chloroflexota bacterium]
MRKSFAVLIAALFVAVFVAACSSDGGGAGGGGGGGGQAVAAGVPPLSSAWFGSSFDPATLSINDKTTTAKAGAPVVVVGHLLSPHDVSSIKVRVSSAGNVEGEEPVVGPNGATSSEILGADLSSLKLGPGTHVVAFVTSTSSILASASLVVSG